MLDQVVGHKVKNFVNIHQNCNIMILVWMGYLSSHARHIHCGPYHVHLVIGMDTWMHFTSVIYNSECDIASRASLDHLDLVPTLY